MYSFTRKIEKGYFSEDIALITNGERLIKDERKKLSLCPLPKDRILLIVPKSAIPPNPRSGDSRRSSVRTRGLPACEDAGGRVSGRRAKELKTDDQLNASRESSTNTNSTNTEQKQDIHLPNTTNFAKKTTHSLTPTPPSPPLPHNPSRKIGKSSGENSEKSSSARGEGGGGRRAGGGKRFSVFFIIDGERVKAEFTEANTCEDLYKFVEHYRSLISKSARKSINSPITLFKHTLDFRIKTRRNRLLRYEPRALRISPIADSDELILEPLR
ncbi:hypothetical protein AAMO2058_000442900 [Amorphochlora amoebiformis]